MEILKALLNPTLLTPLVVLIAVCYLIGEANGGHRPPNGGDPDGETRGADRL